MGGAFGTVTRRILQHDNASTHPANVVQLNWVGNLVTITLFAGFKTRWKALGIQPF